MDWPVAKRHLRWPLDGFEQIARLVFVGRRRKKAARLEFGGRRRKMAARIEFGGRRKKGTPTRYPIRFLRYWFGRMLLDEQYKRIGQPLRVLEVGIGDGRMLGFMGGPQLSAKRFALPNWIKRWNGIDVQEDKDGEAYYRRLSEEISAAWRQSTGTPLRIVIGDPYFAMAASFYSPDHPDSVPGCDLRTAPWVTDERLEREGFAVVCRADNVECTRTLLQRAAGNPLARTREIEVPNRYLGHTSATKKFLILIVPSRALAWRPPGDAAGAGA